MMTKLRMMVMGAAMALLGAAGAASCGSGGEAGEFCRDDGECADGFCCHHRDCAGMCTFSCYNTADCPPDMACHDGICFFRCSRDSDCLQPGFRCEHNNTVCQAD